MVPEILNATAIFCPFVPSNKLENQNFEKMKKTSWRYHHFRKVYHKTQLHDIWFLRYEVQQA